MKWIIVGGLSKGTKVPGYEVHKESVLAVVKVGQRAGIPVFCKDNLRPLFGLEFDKLPRECPPKPEVGRG